MMAHSSHTLRLKQGWTMLIVLCLSSLAGAPVGGSVNAPSADPILFDGSIAPGDVNDLGANDSDAGGQRLAEDFSFPDPVIVTSITFLGGYFPTSTPQTDSFTLTIYKDNMGLPDPLSIVTQIALANLDRTDTGTDVFGIDLYTYTASFAGVSLLGGTRYWLTIVNNTTGDTDDNWAWAGKHEVGNFARSFNGGVTWFDTPAGSFSFLLRGTVDECPNSDLSTTVVIDGCNSGVPNTLFPSGCTISDRIAACAEGASTHGQFVRCVSDVTNDLKKAGTITGQQGGAIESCAGRANIP